jgi:predicted transcriptional regulator
VNIDADGHPEILGGPGWLPETLSAAVELRSFSAAELAERLSLTPQAANNRLSGLVATGGVVRERIVPEGGGKEFGYRVAIPAYA